MAAPEMLPSGCGSIQARSSASRRVWDVTKNGTPLRPSVARAPKAGRIVDRGQQRERRHRPHSGDRHEAPAQFAPRSDLHDENVQPAILSPQRGACRQHGVHQLGRVRIVCHRGAHRLLEAARPTLLNQTPKDFKEGRIALSRSRNLVFRLRRWVSRSRIPLQLSNLM